MEESQLQGNFTTTPLPQVLFLIWRTEKTGSLIIKREKIHKILHFKKGNIVGELASFSENEFLKSLVEKNCIDSSRLEKCKRYASKNKVSLIKSLIELTIFSPPHLWQLMEEFFKEDFFSLFNFEKAEYYFKADNIPYESQLLRENQTLNLIINGIRQMKNYDLVETYLPSDREILENLSPFYLHQINLEPYEKYVLTLIDNSNSLKVIYDLSEIGKRETQKLIFAFLILGIVSLSQKKEKRKYSSEFSPEEFDRILAAFNTKFSYIYKYISKEIGPVALNTLHKCLNDIKPHLGPSFQGLELRPDGAIMIKSFLRMNINLPSDERWKNLIHGLNEILAAEVLTVKRTLGNAHEAALVENLEKIGELT